MRKGSEERVVGETGTGGQEGGGYDCMAPETLVRRKFHRDISFEYPAVIHGRRIQCFLPCRKLVYSFLLGKNFGT